MTLTLDSEPATSGPRLGLRGWLRWAWRSLTSMRTALVLLLLLALASIPGSVFPQRGVDAPKVSEYIAANPTLGPILDRFGMFDVFGSTWFAAIYLLLVISLVGCIVPRSWDTWKSMRRPPPAAPRRLARMPAYAAGTSEADTIDRAAEYLRDAGWRVRRTPDSVAAEKGYLHEIGNLLFHLCFIVLLVGIAVGGLFGWSAKVLLVEGKGFTGSLTQFDTFQAGRLVDPDGIAPFAVTLDKFDAIFQEGGMQNGAPRDFEAVATVTPEPGAPSRTQEFGVNSPLVLPGVKMFLIGHGYAPEVTVTQPDGTVVFDDAVIFLPQDGNLTSTGVVKIPDADPQIGLQAIFLPTGVVDPQRGPISTFPEARNPQLFVAAFTGDLGLDSGIPSNLFALDTENLEQVGLESLTPGQSWELPDGTEIEFSGYRQFVSLSLAHDPGRWVALLAAGMVVVGVSLSLLIQRRRVWLRVSPDEHGRTVAEVAGLSRSGSGRVHEDVAELADRFITRGVEGE